jgi:hypothetical protein
MDSNKKHLNPRKLWSLKGTSWNFCPHIRDIREMLSNGRHQEFDTILISCGVNDIDNMSGTKVHDELLSVVNFIFEKYPTHKVIVSHVTPRKDELNKEVIICNAMLDKSANQSDKLYLVDHTNLQDMRRSILHDTKHIKQESVRHFAGNIKRTLRMSYDIQLPPPRPTKSDVVFVNKDDKTVRLQNIAGYNSQQSDNSNKQYLIYQVMDILKAFLT